MKRLLVANRSEIAIRIFRAAAELGLATIAVYAEEDKLSLHRFKADEAYLVGRMPDGSQLGPVEAYLSIEEIMRVAREANADAIHPGYGFLSESPEFAEACAAQGIVFIGPSPDTMRKLGNKVSARNLAESVDVPVMPATPPLTDDEAETRKAAAEIGYPVMLKASWGGGGRGMRPIKDESGLLDAVKSAKREAKAAFGKDEVYLEKLVESAPATSRCRSSATRHGTHRASFRARLLDPAPQPEGHRASTRASYPGDKETRATSSARRRLKHRQARRIMSGPARSSSLMDADTGKFYFIEVNPRIQVEHTVTEVVTGIDIVKAQIRICWKAGASAPSPDDPACRLHPDIRRLNGHAIQCRITTEDPENNFIAGLWPHHRLSRRHRLRRPRSTGAPPIPARSSPAGTIRCSKRSRPGPDAAGGDRGACTARCANTASAASRPTCAFLEAHPQPTRSFVDNRYTTRFIDETPELLPTQQAPRPGDQAPDLHRRRHRQRPSRVREPRQAAGRGDRTPVVAPRYEPLTPIAGLQAGARARRAPRVSPTWMKQQRDARARHRHDNARRAISRCWRRACAPTTSPASPRPMRAPCRNCCSRWNAGAARPSTSRCASSTRIPWERLALIRERAPNILTQMLLRGANGVGYTNYPDNVVQPLSSASGGRIAASTSSAFSTASTGSRTCASRSTRWPRPARSPRARSATPATCSTRRSAKYDARNIMSKLGEGARGGRLPHPRRQGHGAASCKAERRPAR